MISALIYKEWKKTKWFYLCLQLLGILLLAYIFIYINRLFAVSGALHIWEVIITKNVILFSYVKYFAVAVGLLLGVAQFVPELIQKRIKLTLHLPMTETKIVSTMLVFGQLMILSFFVVHLPAIIIFSYFYFPSEIIYTTILTVLPWYIAGFIVYNLVALISLEPSWKRRISYFLFSMLFMKIYFITNLPGAYYNAFSIIIIPMFIVMPLAFLSISRFKRGVQD